MFKTDALQEVPDAIGSKFAIIGCNREQLAASKLLRGATFIDIDVSGFGATKKSDPRNNAKSRVSSRICSVAQAVPRRLKSLMISRLAFAPGAPVIPPPGCVPAPHK